MAFGPVPERRETVTKDRTADPSRKQNPSRLQTSLGGVGEVEGGGGGGLQKKHTPPPPTTPPKTPPNPAKKKKKKKR